MASVKTNRPRRFNAISQKSDNSLLKIVEQARISGTLNLANKSLTDIPDLFYKDATEGDSSFDTSSLKWWEVTETRKVFLQCNKLREIPHDFYRRIADSLTMLDLSDNCVKDLGSSFGDLKELKILNLSHNEMTSLPDAFSLLQSLADLNISYNKIDNLPHDWGSLASLTRCVACNNNLSELPSSFGMTSNLRHLDLSNNRLKLLPKSFENFGNLETLDLSGNKIANFYVKGLFNLTSLKLDRCGLVKFPEISSCKHLKELTTADNFIENVTVGDLKCLNSLSIVNLRGNKLVFLSDELAAALEQIERLDLSNNSLTSIPTAFGLVETLKALILDGNPLKTIRRDIINRGTTSIKQWLVSRIPSDSSASKENEVLTLGTTNKTSGAGERLDLTACDGLQLCLSHAMDSKAKELVLSKNRLQSLDNVIPFLPFSTLVFLDLSVNMLSSLPAKMGELACLRELNISCNRFKGPLPEAIYSLKGLEVIIVADNQIQSIDPNCLSQLLSLRVLDIRNNSLTTLPPELVNCPSLKTLEVTGNVFKIPRPEVVRKGSSAILDYLRSKLVLS